MAGDTFLPPNTICKVLAGSRAYGTSTPESDWDYRGIFVGTPLQIRTPFFTIKEQADSTEEDTKFYELSQFIKLAVDCNPNIIELLHADDEAIVLSTPPYELLRENASRLLSTKVAFTTTGYALSQLTRIKGHNKWINNPMPENPPTQQQFMTLLANFTTDKVFSFYDVFNTIAHGHVFASYGGQGGGVVYGIFPGKPSDQLFDHTGAIIISEVDKASERPQYIVKFNREEYQTARDKWKNYWDWKRNRNEKRSALEEKYGFDTKHAMHLVRLLRMGVEVLETGTVNVRRADAQELLEIRNGAWTYEQIIDYANFMDDRIKKLVQTSSLPKKPDLKLAAELIIQIQDMAWTTK